MEQLRQEFDALKLAMESKHNADIDKLTNQMSQQKTDIVKYQVDNKKMEEKVELLVRQVDDLTRTNGEQRQQMTDAIRGAYHDNSSSGNKLCFRHIIVNRYIRRCVNL